MFRNFCLLLVAFIPWLYLILGVVRYDVSYWFYIPFFILCTLAECSNHKGADKVAKVRGILTCSGKLSVDDVARIREEWTRAQK